MNSSENMYGNVELTSNSLEQFYELMKASGYNGDKETFEGSLEECASVYATEYANMFFDDLRELVKCEEEALNIDACHNLINVYFNSNMLGKIEAVSNTLTTFTFIDREDNNNSLMTFNLFKNHTCSEDNSKLNTGMDVFSKKGIISRNYFTI